MLYCTNLDHMVSVLINVIFLYPLKLSTTFWQLLLISYKAISVNQSFTSLSCFKLNVFKTMPKSFLIRRYNVDAGHCKYYFERFLHFLMIILIFLTFAEECTLVSKKLFGMTSVTKRVSGKNLSTPCNDPRCLAILKPCKNVDRKQTQIISTTNTTLFSGKPELIHCQNCFLEDLWIFIFNKLTH